MHRWVLPLLIILLLLQVSAAHTLADSYMPPWGVQLHWLQPEQLLVQWHQESKADKTTVMWCKAKERNVCYPYLELFNPYPGLRYAVVPTEPGAIIRFAEYQRVGTTWALLSWPDGTAAPPYSELLPIIRTR